MTPTDTIAAQATPPGRGGVGIVRLSGPAVRQVAEQVVGRVPVARQAIFANFIDAKGAVIDQGIALYFPKPNSFTGEDVLELQGHGGPVVMDLLLQRVFELGVRPARPGEFSERAFINDKLDLAQAEAIADLIEAGSRQAAQSAMRSLQGEFSAAIDSLIEAVTELRMYVEAAIDFPEEEIDFLADRNIESRLEQLESQIKQVMVSAEQGVLLKEGMQVVLAGRPNAGKSSLLNALAGRETAIVTAVPGTTRDVLREEIHIDGMPLHIIDTAGLRDSEDVIELEGIRRTRQMIEQADRLLMVIDESEADVAGDVLPTAIPESIPVTYIHNKIDLRGERARMIDCNGVTNIFLSAKSGAGLDLLRDHLKSCVGYSGDSGGMFIARRRHVLALNSAVDCLSNARQQLQQHRAGELLAEELRLAQQSLGEITGQVSSDELLGRIFSSFCIGK